ncbi:MAG: DUF1049 domain-containing protein [Armatimonadetes bacterium]|nr:DUF1049 domain-containing protein [Armatimonadota bacterium]
MLILILGAVFGLLVAYFAVQNTAPVAIILAGYESTVPLYFVVIGSLLIGLLLSWITSLAESLSSFFTIHGKDSAIKEARKEIGELAIRIHELELENTRLRAEAARLPVGEESPEKVETRSRKITTG